jgi:AcrR family transcriptional regulator
VRAAIATIADLGYRSAPFAQIAKRAGLSSTGLICYHFDNHDDLIQQGPRARWLQRADH